MSFISFVEDCSRRIWIYLLKRKDEAFPAFKSFHAFVTIQTNRNPKCVCTDNGVAFWEVAIKTTIYTFNRSPHTTLKAGIPEEVWSEKPASYEYLQISRHELWNKLVASSFRASSLGMMKVKWAIGYGYLSLRRLYAAGMSYLMRLSCSNLAVPL